MTQGAFRWNDIEVTWQDEAIDYYAVINGLRPGERAVPERTILFSLEPPVRGGGRRKPPVDARPFLAVRDYRTHFPPLEWHLGQTYAELKAASPVKSRVLSAVISSRHELPGHRKRLAFLRFLETRGVALDLYGYRNDAGLASYVGPLPIHRKDDGILPYRYTFNAENQAAPNYCTEKLGDAILGECLCFYWGCPNVHEHLDPRAYIVLDLDDFHASHRRILAAIRNDEWSQRLPAIRREKHRILDVLQFFPTLERAIREHERAAAALGGDLALEHEVPYLIRRYRLTAGRQTGSAPAAADYLEGLWPMHDGPAGARTLLLVTDAGPPPDVERADQCAVIAPAPGAPEPTPRASAPAEGPVSYRCGGGRVVLPREWLTIEDEMPVKNLNLDRRPDRWARTVSVLGEAGLRRYQRVTARDGRALQATDAELGLFHANHFGWRRGVIGCALSHMGSGAAWPQARTPERPGSSWRTTSRSVPASSPSGAGGWTKRGISTPGGTFCSWASTSGSRKFPPAPEAAGSEHPACGARDGTAPGGGGRDIRVRAPAHGRLEAPRVDRPGRDARPH